MTGMPDVRACERARLSRDARFDGLFFTAVRSTGIYCRPVCPAPAPKPQHVMYLPSAAAAEAAGFRPCLRCRPELAPGDPSWRRGDDVVARALALIDEGILVDAPLAALAGRLALGERQLRRLFVDRLGVAPVGVHGTRRLLLAKQLLTDTSMPITDIALAAGFGSLRRFNTVFREAYRMAPRALRRTAAPSTGDTLTLRLGYRPPYDFGAMLDFLRARALPGIEQVDDSSYMRVFGSLESPGLLRVSRWTDRGRDAHALRLELDGSRPAVLLALVNQVRRLFDLDADPASIAAVLGIDRRLRPLLARRPGLRLPGAWDGFETAVRAVVGQQVSVSAARTIAARLVARFGRPLPETVAAHGLTHLFPAPAELADADLSGCGLTPDRARTIRHVARAVADGRIHFQRACTLDDIAARWTELPGIGPWTAQYIAMRALGHPDACPAEDLVLRKALSEDGTPLTARALRARAEAWRPWRAYAVIHLWREAGATPSPARHARAQPHDGQARHRRAGAAGSPRTSSSSHTGALA
jgi:AraC family transcriptional regulator, regulatory protein of adaptative response / DNA-3-methyladenine glycosylase II